MNLGHADEKNVRVPHFRFKGIPEAVRRPAKLPAYSVNDRIDGLVTPRFAEKTEIFVKIREPEKQSDSGSRHRAAGKPLGAAGKPFVKTWRFAGQAGKQAGRSLLELLLPPTCRLCNQPIAGGDFCRSCEASLTLSEPIMASTCPRCGVPRPQIAGEATDRATPPPGRDRCVHCRKTEFSFAAVIAMWSYQDRVCEAVVAAKYAHQSPLADALGRRLSERVADRLADEPADLVTYVPSHLTRQFARGGSGNQTIAAAVAGRIGRPCRSLLRVTRRIAKQAWLDDAERRKNVCGAFSLKKSYAFRKPLGIANRHVLLIDDVLTTGATGNEVARVLREGGARRVTLAVVARALRS